MKSPVNIQELLLSKKPKVGEVLFIAVDGHGGSGKSTLARLIASRLNSQLVQTDDFATWDNPLNWWPLVIEKVFQPIQKGTKTLSYERPKWWEDHRPTPVVDQPVTPIMVLEGVSSLRKEFREYISLGIFVDTPKDICLARGVARDTETGKPKSEITALWNNWLDEEDTYIKRDDPKAYADIVLDGTKPFKHQLVF